MPRVVSIPCAELPAGSVRCVECEGAAPIAIYHLDGEYYATDDTCTHGAASLAEGDIEGDEIVCPFHLGSFDIRTGEPRRAPCSHALRTHAVRVEDGVVIVTVVD